MGLIHKPNKFGLDPFLPVDTVKANYYYGRADIQPDSDDAQRRALIAAARNEDPVIDRTLPWMLLMRGMYALLYKDLITEQNERLGQAPARPGDPLPRPLKVTPQDWARAFNIITFSYVKNQFFRRPQIIKEQITASGQTVALALLIQDPGRGIAKSDSYIRPLERPRTIKILRRMERHRKDLADLQIVKDHLASLRDPEVTR